MPVSFCDSSMCVSCEQTKKGISKTRLKVNLYFARKNKYTITKTTRDKRQILQNDRHQEYYLLKNDNVINYNYIVANINNVEWLCWKIVFFRLNV
jgi:hypothetical protein